MFFVQEGGSEGDGGAKWIEIDRFSGDKTSAQHGMIRSAQDCELHKGKCSIEEIK